MFSALELSAGAWLPLRGGCAERLRCQCVPAPAFPEAVSQSPARPYGSPHSADCRRAGDASQVHPDGYRSLGLSKNSCAGVPLPDTDAAPGRSATVVHTGAQAGQHGVPLGGCPHPELPAQWGRVPHGAVHARGYGASLRPTGPTIGADRGCGTCPKSSRRERRRNEGRKAKSRGRRKR